MKQYDTAYKQEICKRLDSGQTNVTKLSIETGVATNTIYKWYARYRENPQTPFVGSGRPLPENEETIKLRRELKDLREENEFLKKAAAYFAKQK